MIVFFPFSNNTGVSCGTVSRNLFARVGSTPLPAWASEFDAKTWSHFFLKYAAGLEAPMHHHSPDHFGTIISGTMILTADGKDTKLTPGSFFSLQNKAKHAAKCEQGADCIMFIDARGKWDVHMDKAAQPKQ